MASLDPTLPTRLWLPSRCHRRYWPIYSTSREAWELATPSPLSPLLSHRRAAFYPSGLSLRGLSGIAGYMGASLGICIYSRPGVHSPRCRVWQALEVLPLSRGDSPAPLPSLTIASRIQYIPRLPAPAMR